MYDPSEVDEVYTVEESRENPAEYLDPVPSITGPAPFVNFGNYDAAVVGTVFDPRDGPWNFNGSTYEGQQNYGQGYWQ
jgi:hypothetical protein